MKALLIEQTRHETATALACRLPVLSVFSAARRLVSVPEGLRCGESEIVLWNTPARMKSGLVLLAEG